MSGADFLPIVFGLLDKQSHANPQLNIQFSVEASSNT